MIDRSTKKARAALAFTPLEIDILNRLAPESQSGPTRSPTLKSCITQLAVSDWITTLCRDFRISDDMSPELN
jgi:hypothetical protein